MDKHDCIGCIDQSCILEGLEEFMGETLAEEMRVEYLALLIGLHDENKEFMLSNPDLVDEMLGLFGIRTFDNCKGTCGGHAALNAYSNLLAKGVDPSSISTTNLYETYTLIDSSDPDFFEALDNAKNANNTGLHSTMTVYAQLPMDIKMRIRDAALYPNHPDNWEEADNTTEPALESSSDVSVISTRGATTAEGRKIGETTDRHNFEDLDYGDPWHTYSECDALSTLNTNFGAGVLGSFETTFSTTIPSNTIQFLDMRFLLNGTASELRRPASEFVDEFKVNQSNCTSLR